MTLLDDFLHGRQSAVLLEPDGRQQEGAQRVAGLLAGSFNPLHRGHLELVQTSSQFLQAPCHFELCVCNVDKPPLAAEDVRRRLQQFAGRFPVWVTRAPTFVDKARLFPGAVFVVGVDTAERILAPRYYPGGATGLADALSLLRDQGCRFLVAGRRTPEGVFCRLPDLTLPSRFEDLFVEIPPSAFQVDISSTELRLTGNESG